ncbi:hypothetical protein LTR84_000899 [Exophiala bonariae]|uniref:Nicotinamide N-methyltransferase n=1 Tax=Exophiala bonariae TaxID=1690606 RepID=A0AAV9NRY6_9EURO|nr:hypothetical protein LTR84_000899 [Exophiala bonariae]
MFSSRISTPLTSDPTAEDIFESALSTLFTDVTQNRHGTPGASVTYHSPRFGPISLRIPTHPDVEDGRNLFAHYLWNSGVIAADAIEVASAVEDVDGGGDVGNGEDDTGMANESPEAGATRVVDWGRRRYWNVRGKRVLELGAATALPSLISALSGAGTITITDHPSSPALTMGAIEQNVRENITARRKQCDGKTGPPEGISTTATDLTTNIQVLGYVWGTDTMYTTQSYGRPAPPEQQPQPNTYDRIVVADCLWIPFQHGNIVKTILRYLTAQETGPEHEEEAEDPPCALVITPFHTGRGIVRNFFGLATGEWKGYEDDDGDGQGERDPELADVSGKLKALEMFEIDVDGIKRPWQPIRQDETKNQAKRWCVCAVLARR